jgi:hypothetical protein
MKSGSNFPNGSSESVYGDDDEVVAFSEPADAFRPPGSVATGASGSCVGENPVRNDACSRNSIVLLVDGLLSGGDAKIGGDTHLACNKKSPTINPVSDPGVLGMSCGTGKSDYPTCSDVMP